MTESVAEEQVRGRAIETPRGHDAVVQRLRSLAVAVGQGRHRGVAHAYMFSGAMGVGKFKTAMWWAARLKCATLQHCEPAATGEPESLCASCRHIDARTHPDLNVLNLQEPGKEIGIDEARQLIRSMSLKPLYAGPRVAIVRDAHALSLHAQSALLKLIEEPPGFAVIVLITENPAALLATVRSRCQTIRLGLLSEETIAALLERAGCEPARARAAATAAVGSVGRALALTDEALTDRRQLLDDFERFRSEGSPDIVTFVDDLTERTRADRHGLDTLLEWQLKKIEAGLGYPRREDSDRLTKILSGTSARETAALLEEASRIHWTIGALRRRANAKLAIRDLLLDIRHR